MRFETLYDEGDWIIDTETGEYLSIEDACGLLNDYYDESRINESFWKTFFKKLDEATEEE